MGNRCNHPNPVADSTNTQTKKKTESTELEPISNLVNGTVQKERSLVSSRRSPVFSGGVVEPWSSGDESVEPQVTGSSVQADHELAHLKQIVAEKDEEIESLRKQLHDKEQLLEEVEETVQTLKEKLIELQQSLQGKWTLKWTEKVAVPTDSTMQRGSAATVGGVAFFNPGNTNTVYSYENYSQDWKELPTCPHYNFTLVAVDGVPTAVGGSQQEHTPGNALLSFAKGEWTEMFPPMAMQRSSPAAVCTSKCLVVAGGCSGSSGENLSSSVEIMNTDTRQWHTAATTNVPLPKSYDRIATSGSASMAACGDKIYMFEGGDRTHVYTCFLSSLLQSHQQSSDPDHTGSTGGDDAHTTWRRVVDLPVSQSTPVALCGRLLSIGGYSDIKEVDTVYYYEPTTDTWQEMGTLICPQGFPLAAALPGDKLIVVHSNNNESFVGTSIVVEVS